MTKRPTKAERRLALRVLRRAVALSVRNYNVNAHQEFLWRIMVAYSNGKLYKP